jgi:hypothetical protein
VTLFDDLVSAIEPTLRSVAPFILTRLLLRAGILDRRAMTVAEFRRVMPTVEAGLRESLNSGDVSFVVGRILEVVNRWEAASLTGSNEGAEIS